MNLLTSLTTNTLGTTNSGFLLASSASDQPETGQVLIWLVAAATIIGAIVGGLALATRAAHKRRCDSHSGLFAGLCQHHNLDRSRKNLLKALGQAHRVRYAARVFLDPTLFEPTRLPPALSSRKDEILALRQQLFLAPNAASPPQGEA